MQSSTHLLLLVVCGEGGKMKPHLHPASPSAEVVVQAKKDNHKQNSTLILKQVVFKKQTLVLQVSCPRASAAA